MPAEAESLLIARAVAGDQDAMSALYTHYAPSIRRYLAAYVRDGDLADDLCGDVFVKVLRKLDQYEDRGYPFGAWLFHIARMRAIEELRRQGRRPTARLYPDLVALPAPDTAVLARLTARELCGAMACLRPDHRLVVTLRFYEDRSLADVASALGRSVGAIKALQHRGLAHMRRCLATDG